MATAMRDWHDSLFSLGACPAPIFQYWEISRNKTKLSSTLFSSANNHLPDNMMVAQTTVVWMGRWKQPVGTVNFPCTHAPSPISWFEKKVFQFQEIFHLCIFCQNVVFSKIIFGKQLPEYTCWILVEWDWHDSQFPLSARRPRTLHIGCVGTLHPLGK